MSKLVNYSCDNRIGIITLNRPEKRNALNEQVVIELKAAFNEAASDDSCKVIVLKANGDAFCAGADLGYLQQLQKNSFEENLEDSRNLKDLFEQIQYLNKVVIAQVEGHAIAGGCGLATVCDFTFSVPEAKFGYTEVKIGFVPAIVSVFLVRKIGEAKAKDLLLTGRLIDALEAEQMSLIYKVVSKNEIEIAVNAFAEKLCLQTSAASLALTKKLIADIAPLSYKDAFELAAETNAKARETEDCKKGIAAFLNKVKLTW
ncbi:MAG: methylglutaconyl-CoA hydratase [Flavobacteriales bacterium]|jgi:methylglutaconyl-CoA hydratase